MENDTIVAISTGLSDSGISIVRISGDEAFVIADKVFKAMSGKKVDEMKSFTVSYGHIYDQDILIDEVLLIKMKEPKTYTRENIVEIDCHGGIIVTKKVLDTIIKYGARPAEPGEFTKRAFLNGRIDLSQAEAVIDIIHSKNEYALKNSLMQLKGNIKDQIAGLRNTILSKTAYIEAALDDPEHMSLNGFSDELTDDIRKISNSLTKLIESYDNGRMIKEGINTVILGKPNAGKSSLLNALMGEERAIVTDIAGTTRDTLEETINIKGVSLNIIDTAGIRQSDNIIEQIGVNKAKSVAMDADLILYVLDSSADTVEIAAEVEDIIKEKKTIMLLNKSDIVNETDLTINIDASKFDSVIRISAKTGEGIDKLSDIINDMFFSGKLQINDEIYITNIRQKNLLMKARESLHKVQESIDAGMPEDFYSIDLMDAYVSLGLITGDNVEDDLADRIFSEFCMGK